MDVDVHEKPSEVSLNLNYYGVTEFVMRNVLNRLEKFNPNVKLAKMMRVFALLTGLTLFIFISTARAGQNCNTAASNANKGCNSDFSGCPDQQAAGTAAQSQMASGSGATAAAGATQAGQCQAQQTQSNNLSNLTSLVGQCCASAIKKCDQACDQDAKTDPQSQMATDKQNRSGCDKLTANVTAANGQSAEQAANAAGNAACKAATSAMPALPAAPTAPAATDPSALAASTPLPNCAAGQQLDANNNCVSTNQVAADSQVVGPATPIGTASSPNGTTRLADGTAPAGGAASTAGGGSGSGGSGGFSGGAGVGEAAAALKASEAKDAQNRILLSKLDAGGGGGGGSGVGERFGDSPGFSPFKMPGLDKKKNPPGMTVKAVDGITAPTGASLFEKISQQYQRQKPKLFNDN